MTALIKAIVYSLTGYMMAWCWDFGHNKWFAVFGAAWAVLMAWDLVQAMLPVRRDDDDD